LGFGAFFEPFGHILFPLSSFPLHISQHRRAGQTAKKEAGDGLLEKLLAMG